MSQLRRGDIFFANLGHKCRPYLVVSNDIGNHHSNRVIIVPLTTRLDSMNKHYPTHCIVCPENMKTSCVQCEEIRNADVSPNWHAVSHLSGETMWHVDKALKIALGVDR